MKTTISFLAVAFCAISFLSAQLVPPSIHWQNTIGGSGTDFLLSIQQTSDGGYILGGTSESNISGDKTENSLGGKDFWVVKLNDMGVIQWQNTIGGNNLDELAVLQQTLDGGYILGGTSYSDISGDKTENSNGYFDYWVLKLDPSGAIQWQNTLGGSSFDYLRSLQQTSDGGYILGGTSNSNISGDKTENSNGLYDYWVVKLDVAGTIQWQNTIGGFRDDELSCVRQTSDGGYILGGSSISDISGDKTKNSWGNTILGPSYDYWIVKLYPSGAIQWQNTIGGRDTDKLACLQQTSDGGYILGGTSNSRISGDKTEPSIVFDSNDYWVVEVDFVGNILWENTIGGNWDDFLHVIKQTPDGGYIVGGTSNSSNYGDKSEPSVNDDYWVLKLNAAGAISWQKTIVGDDVDELFSLQRTSDGGYILGGYSNSTISDHKTENSNGGYDYWIVKLGFGVPSDEAPTVLSDIIIYPNPTADALFVRTDTERTLSLCNAVGQSLLTQNIIGGTGKIDISSLPEGVYFLVEIETGIWHKILKPQ